MNDTDRFEEIEARLRNDAVEVLQHPECFYRRDYIERSIADRQWLITKAREYMTQLAWRATKR
jgi:hypothetical protein